MRNLIFTTFGIILFTALEAQQLPQSTHHMFNRFYLNPAVAGSDMYMEALTNFRYQWTGYQNSPSNQILSVQSSFYKSHSGVGGYLFNYSAGPVRNTGISLVYAYHIEIVEDIKLGLGLGAVLGQYRVDGNKIILTDIDDPLIDLTRVSTSVYPEINFGTYLYSPDFYAGLSALNLTNHKTEVFSDLGTGAVMPRSTHINVIGAYRIAVSDELEVIPSAFINYVINNPVQLDLNFRFDYNKFIQSGIGFRTGDALTLLVGANIVKDLTLVYSYDIQISRLSGHTGGSHEITLRYKYFYNAMSRSLYERDFLQRKR